MECTIYPDKGSFDAAALSMAAPTPYPVPEPSGSVAITLAAIPAKAGAELRILSRKAGGLLFSGPISPSVTLPFDAHLESDDGWDSIGFAVVDRGNLRICNAVNDKGIQIWRPGTALKITFLPEPEFDEDDLMRMYRVEKL